MTLIFKKSTAQPVFTQQATAAGNASVGVTLNGLYALQKRARTVTTEWWRYTSIALENPTLVGTASDYQIQAGDAGHYLEFIVTASNAAGTVVSRSGITAQVVGSGNPEPEFTAGAVIAGQPKVGSTLTVSWSAVYADTETVQWQASADNVTFANIVGATSPTYLLTASEQGDHIRAVVTIDSPSYDPVTSTSAATGQVAAADAELPPPAGAPAGAIPLNSANIASLTQHDGAIYLNTANAYYYLVGDMTFTGAAFLINKNGITLDFNGCTVTYNTANENTVWNSGTGGFLTSSTVNKHGISGGGYFDSYYPGITFNARTTGVTLKNGTLTTTASGRSATFGIWQQSGSGGWSISNMKIVGPAGNNTFAVASNFNPYNITDSVIVDRADATWNRQQNPAAVFAQNASVYMRRSVVIGGNNGVNCRYGSDIESCFISHNSFATNGYGVTPYATDNWRIVNNLIMPLLGRGVIANNGSGITIDNNVLLTWEAPNAEFGDGLNAPAIRSRYDVRGLSCTNNFSLGVGGKNPAKGQDLTGGTGIYLTNTNANLPYNTFTNNECHSILIGTTLNGDIQAVPITLEGQGSYGAALNAGEDTIEGNRFYSNNGMIRMSGRDGYCQQNNPLRGNVWGWRTGPESYAAFEAAAAAKLSAIGLTGERYTEALARYTVVLNSLAAHINDAEDAPLHPSRVFWRTLAYTHAAEYEYADLVDSTFESGVDPLSYSGFFPYQSGIVLRDGFTHEIQITVNGTPLADAIVTATPIGISIPDDAPVSAGASANTDAGGNTAITLWRRAIAKALPADSPVVAATATQSTISVTDLAGDPIPGTEPKTVTYSSLGATLDVAVA